MDCAELRHSIEREQRRGENICRSLRTELLKLGFGAEEVPVDDFQSAQFELSRDPYAGQHTLVGTWKSRDGRKKGSILFHADGSFYAEYDVARPHPGDDRWFVGSVTAWGRDERIMAEPALLQMPT